MARRPRDRGSHGGRFAVSDVVLTRPLLAAAQRVAELWAGCVSGALTVNDKAANTAVTLQTPDDSAVSVTLNKHKEVSFLIEDIARAFARPGGSARAARRKLAGAARRHARRLHGFDQRPDPGES